MGIEDIRDALVIREGDIFLLTDGNGNVPRGNPQGLGLYHDDTRHLSVYDFYFHSPPQVVLLSTAELGFSSEQVLTNPRLTMPDGQTVARGTIEVRRQRVIADLLEETIRVSNFGAAPVTLELVYEFDADFADIMEVRGAARASRGVLRPPEVTDEAIVYAYEGLDGRFRETRVAFRPRPARISAVGAVLEVKLGRRESRVLRLAISVHREQSRRAPASRFRAVADRHRRWSEGSARVSTDNEFFNRVLERSLADIRVLWSKDDRGDQYPAAGTPWFDTLFGRDSIILSLQMLPFRQDIARHCLRVLARRQGSRLDPWRDEEPGKILHEVRRGEMSAVGELPYACYYGSVDSTPLYLLLAAEYYAWTGDLHLLRELRPAMLAALDWIERYGDSDGDGYVEYEKRSLRGLVNQGWKDSADSIVYAEGTPVRPPVALVEVQGYVYAAKRRLGPLLRALGLPDLADRLRREAFALRRRFNRDFWLPDLRYYALALDGNNRPCATVSSNPGHALWTGIVASKRAPDAAARLLSNDLFSGWGIRTVSAASPRYNPLGYHLGTVWPHDNAIAALGLKMYGLSEQANEVTTALFDAACAFDYCRLPELFSGDARSAYGAPVPYPVACRPQAWAAGSFPMLLQAMLGLRADAESRTLWLVRPSLPFWLGWVRAEGLRVGSGHADLLFRRRGSRTTVEVRRTSGGLRVRRVRRGPL